MPMPTILPTGQLHPDLFNGPFVKRISSTPAATGEPGVKVTGDAIASLYEKRLPTPQAPPESTAVGKRRKNESMNIGGNTGTKPST